MKLILNLLLISLLIGLKEALLRVILVLFKFEGHVTLTFVILIHEHLLLTTQHIWKLSILLIRLSEIHLILLNYLILTKHANLLHLLNLRVFLECLLIYLELIKVECVGSWLGLSLTLSHICHFLLLLLRLIDCIWKICSVGWDSLLVIIQLIYWKVVLENILRYRLFYFFIIFILAQHVRLTIVVS